MITKVRFAFVVLGSLISATSFMRDDEVSKFDKVKFVTTQVVNMQRHLSERFGADKLSLDDATNWTLLVSHTGLRPNSPLCNWFQTNPELKKLWDNPNVTEGFTGPQYRGWDAQPYSQYLTANGVVLMDGSGDKVFLARGDSLPKTANELVAQISEHIQTYYHDRGVKEINSAAAKYVASEDGSGESSWFPTKFLWRRRDGTPRPIWPWNWGRNRPDCPDCPSPVEPTPHVAYEPAQIEDSVSEPEPEETNIALFVLPLLGALGIYAFKVKGELQ